MENLLKYTHVTRFDLKKHNVRYLYHFTQSSNLKNISKYGLLPKTILDDESISFQGNDHDRWDGHPNAISLSISFPNYKMFYRYRTQVENKNVSWAILQLDAEKILCNPSIECAYYWFNAADARMARIGYKALENNKAFHALFLDRLYVNEKGELEYLNDRRHYCKESGAEAALLPLFYPTNPQAEVLVFSGLSPQFINNIYFQSQKDLDEYRFTFPHLLKDKIWESKYKVYSQFYFKARKDYQYWNSGYIKDIDAKVSSDRLLVGERGKGYMTLEFFNDPDLGWY